MYEIQKIENGRAYKSALKVITIPQSDAEIENAYSDGMSEADVTQYFKSIVDIFANELDLISELKDYSDMMPYEEHRIEEHQGKLGWDILIRMELLTPLSRWIEEHPMSVPDVINLGCDMCRVMELCHKNKMIGIGIKIQNIFVDAKGNFKLGDLEVTRAAEKISTSFESKVPYICIVQASNMAPEIYKGMKYAETADIYSLGFILYSFLNYNCKPFVPLENADFNDYHRAQERRIAGEPIPAPETGSDKLKQIVLKMLQYEPENRIQSAAELRCLLEQCRDELESPREELPVFSETPKVVKKKSKRIGFLAVVVIMVVIAAVAGILFFSASNENKEDKEEGKGYTLEENGNEDIKMEN